MAVLVLADHDKGALTGATARLVSAAAELGPVDLLLAGSGLSSASAAAAAIAGVHRVKVVDSAALSHASAEALTDLLAELAEPYSHIIAAANAVGRDVIPRLAARLDLMPVTDVVRILAPNRFERPIYAGNALETVTSPQTRHLLTIRTSAFRPARADNAAPIDSLASAVAAITDFVADYRTESGRADLATAQIVVSGGIAVGSREGFRLIEDLAAALGGAVGATRAAVDAGYAPNDWQVGQTGKIIAPDLYIGIGVSGALQHLAGIQGAKKIIAINKDPEAPLMKIADYALVGDLFQVVPDLIKAFAR